jgi:hypothetical protein
MNMDSYKYDLAFSFTQKDEQIAKGLYGLLSDRLKCFLYTESQKEIAFKDGQKAFSDVYNKESRFVVILFNDTYGKTKWTRVEETAIRNRAFDHGFDFCLFIPTEKDVIKPEWLPPTYLYYGLQQWGVTSAAAIIEDRVKSAGGIIREMSAADIAAKSETDITAKKERELNINLANALEEINVLSKLFALEIEKIIVSAPGWNLQYRENKMGGFDAFGQGYTLQSQWHQQYRNSLTDSVLGLILIKGYVEPDGTFNRGCFEETQILHRERFFYYINEQNESGWISESKKKFSTSSNLINDWVNQFVNRIVKSRKR